MPMSQAVADCEYIVVGSGAGGGTVAARLAEAGRRVILLEAGGDPRHPSVDAAVQPDASRLPYDYDVPAFHGFASENEAMSWSFFVRHYADEEMQERDPKYLKHFKGREVDGVFYPRSGTLGGCTAHNAMILVYPHNADWDQIAAMTGDSSWNADSMRRYFERLENCRHRPLQRWLAKLGLNPTRHGWRGWLPTEKAIPLSVIDNRAFAQTLADSALEAFAEDGHQVERIRWFIESGLDPNDWRLVRENSVGVRYLPLTTQGHRRIGTRERVLDVARRYPDRLRIILNALATRVLFDGNNRAIGVEYIAGERLYRASNQLSGGSGQRVSLFASREVILSGGAFNSPQLLMLSGVGPREVLEHHSIPVRAALDGVGRNLQDRYEIGVVNRMNFKRWDAYNGATFQAGDPQFTEWESGRCGVYSTNGSVLTLFRRSPQASELPDLFCMSLLARFSGYYPSYSKRFAEDLNYLTWVVLKGHTRNRAGQVTLRSNDPCDTPLINFNYFEDGGEQDLDAVVDGVRFVRRLTEKLQRDGLIAEEELPGAQVQTNEELKEFVKSNAWGHHASCTCAIGPADQGGVLTSDFRVHGTSGLRVVDASVFPRIPGFFIVSAVYMIAEKAADVILTDAKTRVAS
ncbi:MAG: GMC family oxidoreductase [Acidobacteriaceae bacterium]|nr:GMC family oxidoreductase [Acidobacteriaceae bacterium]